MRVHDAFTTTETALLRGPVLGFPERLAALAAAAVTCAVDFAPIPSVLALAVLLVVPIGLRLARPDPLPFEAGVRALLLPCGLAAALALACDPGVIAAALAVPWLALSAALALLALRDVPRVRCGAVELADVAACLYLPVGAAWLVASRLGLQPLGFTEPIVALTAVHFHFAGFAAPVLAARARTRLAPRNASRARVLRAVQIGVVVGPPLLAAGFVVAPALKAVAVAVIGASLLALALVSIAARAALHDARARALLVASSLAVVAGVALAAVYAHGELTGRWWLLIGQMERTHGWIQALGFALCGLLAWRIEGDRRPDAMRLTTPSRAAIQAFALAQRARPLSYARAQLRGWWRNHGAQVVGHGDADFARAADAVRALRMFPAWTAVGTDLDSRPHVPVELGCVCVTGARVLGLYALNACRVLEVFDGPQRAGFVYGTLVGHPMRGEERFEVRCDADGRVVCEIESFSRPGHPLTWCLAPLIRGIQRRFVRDALPRIAAAARGG